MKKLYTHTQKLSYYNNYSKLQNYIKDKRKTTGLEGKILTSFTDQI